MNNKIKYGIWILLLIGLFFYSRECYFWDGEVIATGEWIGGYKCEINYLTMISSMAIVSLVYFGVFYFIEKKKSNKR